MRIECENCSATYTIDDSQLSDAPIGAQCPYCGHVKLVQKGGSVPPSFPMSSFGASQNLSGGGSGNLGSGNLGSGNLGSGSLGSGSLGSGSLGSGSLGSGSLGSGGFSFGGSGSLGGSGNLGPGPAQGPTSFGLMGNSGDLINSTPDIQSGNTPGAPPGFQPTGQSGFGQTPSGGYGVGGRPARGLGDPSGPSGLSLHPAGDAPRFGGSSLDLSLSDDVGGRSGNVGAPGAYSAPRSNDLGIPGQVSVADSSPATCQVCGAALNDEFDKVIGLCDEHQRDRRYGDDTAAPAPAAASGVGAQWHARGPDGLVSGPMTLEEIRARIRNGQFSLTDEFSRDGIDFGPIARFKELAYLASLSGENQIGLGGPSFARASFSFSLGRLVTPILVLLIVGAVGYLGYRERDQLGRLVEGITSTAGSGAAAASNPLQRYRDQWLRSHPNISGTAAEQLVTAKARHLEDTWRGYRQAHRAFQRAILLDDQDADAVAGYVENLVVWKYALLSPDERRVAEAAARYAVRIEPESAAAHRALGALALRRRDLNGCRAGADAALQRDATDGRATLLLAECYMEGNVALAVREAERAQKLMPELRRADRVKARAYAKQGRFASAFQVLSERITVDPNNAAPHRLYGEIAREVGEVDEARGHFVKALSLDGDQQATLIALAELALENDRADEAVTHYRRLSRSKLYADRGARVYAGWARAELVRRRGRRAVELAEQALRFSRRDPAALLARGEAALYVRSATTAALYAKQAESARAGEPAVLVLAGRALSAQDLHEQAIKKMHQALTNDPQDPRLKGVLAAEYLRQRSEDSADQAFTLMVRAATVDPRAVDARSRAGLLALSPLAVKEAIRQFRRAAIDERNAPVANASIGLLYYHMGDRDRAKAAIERALRLDDVNETALIYQAQLALDRGDRARARKYASKLLAYNSGSALGYLMLARATAAYGKLERARELYRSALRNDRGLLSAKVELAGLDLDTSERPRAIQQLQEAYLINPSSLTIRRLLLKAGL